MSLTLTIEEEKPELVLSLFQTSLPSYEFVYHVNRLFGFQFAKHSNALRLKRNKTLLAFNYFEFKSELDKDLFWILENNTKTKDSSYSLFEQMGGIEQSHYLLKTFRNYEYILMFNNEGNFKLDNNHISQIPQLKHAKQTLLEDLNNMEQQTILNFYYEKQD